RPRVAAWAHRRAAPPRPLVVRGDGDAHVPGAGALRLLQRSRAAGAADQGRPAHGADERWLRVLRPGRGRLDAYGRDRGTAGGAAAGGGTLPNGRGAHAALGRVLRDLRPTVPDEDGAGVVRGRRGDAHDVRPRADDRRPVLVPAARGSRLPPGDAI